MTSDERIAEGARILAKYKSAKAALERRVIADEEWWRKTSSGEEESTAWLFNAVANKHADAMDNYPSPAVLPREEGDSEAARQLSKILPVILDSSDFEKVYSEVWYDKLKYGAGCYGVFWDPAAHRGKGDVSIKKIDLLNLYWEGGINDLQSSANVFYTELWSNDEIRAAYPHAERLGATPGFDGAKYVTEETVDESEKSVVVDWYYKRRVGGKCVLHLCKFAGGEVLFCSENEPGCEGGIYAHGKYPFFIDRLYSVQGSPCGFGMIDVMKGTQAQIDRLSRAAVKNAELSGAVRYFIRTDGAVNEEEFADFTSPFVHVHGSRLGDDSLRQIKVSPLDPVFVSILQNKITELKETSGNRDFTQGGTASGVTAASAIAALQEAGSKLSRDMISASYRVFRDAILLAIELIRQFYTAPRVFRILGEDGEFSFLSYSGASIAARRASAFGYDFGEFAPEFDVKVSAEKRSPFARVTQNELAKEFYTMGFFSPDRRAEAAACISMMDFEGKEKLLRRLSQPEGETSSKEEARPAHGALYGAVKRAAFLGGEV